VLLWSNLVPGRLCANILVRRAIIGLVCRLLVGGVRSGLPSATTTTTVGALDHLLNLTPVLRSRPHVERLIPPVTDLRVLLVLLVEVVEEVIGGGVVATWRKAKSLGHDDELRGRRLCFQFGLELAFGIPVSFLRLLRQAGTCLRLHPLNSLLPKSWNPNRIKNGRLVLGERPWLFTEVHRVRDLADTTLISCRSAKRVTKVGLRVDRRHVAGRINLLRLPSISHIIRVKAARM